MLLHSVVASALCAGLVAGLPNLGPRDPNVEYFTSRDFRKLLNDAAQVSVGFLQDVSLGTIVLGETVFGHDMHPPPKHGDSREEIKHKTIFQALEYDPKFSKVFKAVNATDDVIKVLNDSDAKVTFFAPPNWALPSHHEHHDDCSDLAADDCELLRTANALAGVNAKSRPSRDEIKAIIRAALFYHILPETKTVNDLASNTTWATKLTIGDSSLDDEPQRIRTSFTSRIAPVLSVNVYAKVVDADIETVNGIVQEINHPLFPPSSIFESVFLLQDIFSTVTSALGRVGMIDQIDYHQDEEKYFGSPTVTFFAPTNKAFQRLPRKLKLFLFSKYGQKVLQKLLEYHILPGVILHSDWVHDVSESSDVGLYDLEPRAVPSPVTPIFVRNITADTLLADKTVNVYVAQIEHKIPLHPPLYTTEVRVNGHRVRGADLVARNGAFHVIDRLLNPMKHHDHDGDEDEEDELFGGFAKEDEWDGWEEWLPRWADEC